MRTHTNCVAMWRIVTAQQCSEKVVLLPIASAQANDSNHVTACCQSASVSVNLRISDALSTDCGFDSNAVDFVAVASRTQ